jgi:nucleoside-diphosphate-sugar epimerase
VKKRILITGSTGYMGTHLTQRLLTSKQADIYAFNRAYDTRIEATQCLEGNLLSANLLGWLDDVKPDVVFHCIGAGPRVPFEHQLLLHAEGTRRLLQALIDTGQSPRIIVTGSAAEYGLQDEAVEEQTVCHPDGEYGISKLTQTQVAQSFAHRYNLPVVIGRVFNVYGQTQRHLAIASLASQIAHAEMVYPEYAELHVYNLRSRRDFIHMDDVVEALVALSALPHPSEASGQVYNIGSGYSTPISTILDWLLEHSRLNAAALKKVSMRLHGAQKEDNSFADITKIRQHTDWEPKVSLDRGLHRELNYWRTHVHSNQSVPVG